MTLKDTLIKVIESKGDAWAHDMPRNTMGSFYFCSDGKTIWYQWDGKESRYSRNCETPVSELDKFIEKYEYARSRDLG